MLTILVLFRFSKNSNVQRKKSRRKCTRNFPGKLFRISLIHNVGKTLCAIYRVNHQACILPFFINNECIQILIFRNPNSNFKYPYRSYLQKNS